MQLSNEELKEHGFCEFKNIDNKHSKGDIFQKIFNGKNICGIYILAFQNGMYYVGQSINIWKRFIQHNKNYDDIIAISFKNVEKKT